MADNQIHFAKGKASSSKCPPFHLIPAEGERRIAARFQLGIDNRPDGTAWNACSSNQECLTDRKFVLDRIAHVIDHAHKLRDKVIAGRPMDGDDDAAAIGWAAHFLCCATQALEEERAVAAPNCSACGGKGDIVRDPLRADETPTYTCPACRGTGKTKLK